MHLDGKICCTFSDIEAVHVRKGMFFNPDPYVKIRVEPGQETAGQPVLAHHYKDTRTSVCENTTDPRWNHEVCIPRLEYR